MNVPNTFVFEVALLVNVHAANISEANYGLQSVVDAIDEVICTPGFVTNLCSIISETGEDIYESSIDFIPFPILNKER